MMKKTNLWNRCTVAAFLMTISVAGCRSAVQPAAFYTLSSIQATESKLMTNSEDVKDLMIGIGPAQFPDYLDRPQIVTRSGPNRLSVSEFNRWGGRLDQNFLNIFAENLSILLSTHKMAVYPWKGSMNPDYRIALNVQQFDGEIGDSVRLNVTWMIRGRDDDSEPLYTHRSMIQKPSGQDYDAMVAAYSDAVAELSRETATVLLTISKQAPVKSQ